MIQTVYTQIGKSIIKIELPPEDSEVVDGVIWGNVAAFPSVAYWAFQVLERRLSNRTIHYKLGRTLLEEVGACLLGGHGIPAYIGLAAYEHLKDLGAFDGQPKSEAELYQWLSRPILANGKAVKYRFAKQKARYLADAILKLAGWEQIPAEGITLRNKLTEINGIGLKTASWVARNWLDADDVAILDIHIYRAGLLAGFFPPSLTVEKDYLELERRFVEVAKGMDIRTSEFDAVIWHEMQGSSSVLALIDRFYETVGGVSNKRLSTNKRKASTKQLSFA